MRPATPARPDVFTRCVDVVCTFLEGFVALAIVVAIVGWLVVVLASSLAGVELEAGAPPPWGAAVKGAPGKAALALRELDELDVGMLDDLCALSGRAWETSDARVWCRLERLGCVTIDHNGVSLVEPTPFGLEVLERAAKARRST